MTDERMVRGRKGPGYLERNESSRERMIRGGKDLRLRDKFTIELL